MNFTDKICELMKFRSDRDKLTRELAQLNNRIASIEHRIGNEMIEDCKTSVRLDSIGCEFIVKPVRYPTIKNQFLLNDFLKKNFSDIKFIEHVDMRSLRALNNKHFNSEGCDLPGCESFIKLTIEIKEGS